jgi:hypothetical protein
MNGTHINIEVVAITETRKPLAKTERQQKAELYGGVLGLFYGIP